MPVPVIISLSSYPPENSATFICHPAGQSHYCQHSSGRKMMPISSPKTLFWRKSPFLSFLIPFFSPFSSPISTETDFITAAYPASHSKWYLTARRFCVMMLWYSPDFSIIWQWCQIIRRFSLINFRLLSTTHQLFYCVMPGMAQNDATFIAKSIYLRPSPLSGDDLIPFSSP